MYNSIQHFLDHGISKIEKDIKNFLQQEEDITDLVLNLQKRLNELGVSVKENSS